MHGRCETKQALLTVANNDRLPMDCIVDGANGGDEVDANTGTGRVAAAIKRSRRNVHMRLDRCVSGYYAADY